MTSAEARSGRHSARLGSLSFQHPWRTYQRLMLARIEHLDQHTFHLVAPPGSGKTIVGLELIRRGGRPAVVFEPTTTIAGQWVHELPMFTEDGQLARQLASLSPDTLSTINVFTYQRVSTQDLTDRGLEDRAIEQWREQLVLDDAVTDQAAGER